MAIRFKIFLMNRVNRVSYSQEPILSLFLEVIMLQLIDFIILSPFLTLRYVFRIIFRYLGKRWEQRIKLKEKKRKEIESFMKPKKKYNYYFGSLKRISKTDGYPKLSILNRHDWIEFDNSMLNFYCD